MNFLLVAATENEVNSLLQNFTFQEEHELYSRFRFNKHQIDVLITGVGMVYTTFYLTRLLNTKKYDWVINAGIAGSFAPDIAVGQVVNVIQETMADLGIETSTGFHTLFEENISNPFQPPFKEGTLNTIYHFHRLADLKKVKGITVNTVHGNEKTIAQVKNKFNPQIESMEGAAVFLVCLMQNQPFIEIRSISNRIEKRDKSAWDIPLAIKNLTNALLEIIDF